MTLFSMCCPKCRQPLNEDVIKTLCMAMVETMGKSIVLVWTMECLQCGWKKNGAMDMETLRMREPTPDEMGQSPALN